MKLFLSIILCISVVVAANAGELVHTPYLPAFGGNPLNSNQIQTEASAQKPSAPTPQISSSQQFLEMLQSQLYGSLANAVSQAILGSNGTGGTTPNGSIQLNGMTLSWVNTTTQSSITIISATGQATNIVIPLL